MLLFTFFSCQKKAALNEQKNNTLKIQRLITKADQFYNSKKNDSAFVYYNKAKFICDTITDPAHYVYTINRMAEIQQKSGDYAGSENTASEAIPYLKYLKLPKDKWKTYVIQGTNYMNTYDFKNAQLNFDKALELSSNESQKIIVQNNIAFVYMRQNKYKDALKKFLPLTINKTVLKSPNDNSCILDNIGYCLYKIQNNSAVLYLNSALKIRIETKDTCGMGRSYLHLAKFYEKQNLVLSKKYAALSYKNFTSIHKTSNRLYALKQLIKTSPYTELKKHSLEYIKINDSIKEVRQKAKNRFAKIKYDSKIEKEENLKLKTYKVENELMLERQKSRNIILYIIIIISLSLVLVLYFYLTTKAKKERIEAAYKSETRIAKKLHDELANDIYHTMAFAENKNLSIIENKVQLLNNLEVIYSRTRDISNENFEIITGEDYISSLKEMISGFNTPNIHFIINGLDSIMWNKIEKNKKTTVYRVLQELLVNMKKYSDATLISINFKQTDKSIIINYTDNGKGIDISKIIFKDGLHNVENRILKIKGEINIYSEPNNGFKVFIKFPY
ncbi:histidine kinase [Flavobacterium reichenbachii]|uniref:histidine kinase n=2 Tax=Flavobacterium reichenbachii TaxID=362418 RepID=A0A085ZI20_9FLAO|nr:histidine kinase [Flavobacterium reichenbachii]